VLISASESSLVETESIGHVFLIGINRPDKRNCVNQATAQQLSDAVNHFETDEELRVAVLYGKGLMWTLCIRASDAVKAFFSGGLGEAEAVRTFGQTSRDARRGRGRKLNG